MSTRAFETLIYELIHCTQSFITSIVYSVIYGREIAGMDDEWVELAERIAEGSLQAIVPGAFWVEFFPFTKHIPSWVPGTSFWKHVHEYLPLIRRLRDEPYETVKTAIVSVCFVTAVSLRLQLNRTMGLRRPV